MEGICYHFHARTRGYARPSAEEIEPLVGIAKFLIRRGFVFCRATTGGGINEISHSGDAAYDVSYRDLGTFARNFVQDFHREEQEESKRTGGWVSSLNYGYVDVYLRRGSLLVRGCVERGFSLYWYGAEEEDAPLLEAVNEFMTQFLMADNVIGPNPCQIQRTTRWEK